MTHIKFDYEQCNSFILDSKSHYKNPETTNPRIIIWKFMGFVSHPSYHLYIRDPEGVKNSGRAVLNTRTLNLKGNCSKVTQVTDLLVVKSKAGLMTFINLITQYNSLGLDVVLHTSNENSEKIYSKFFKFKEVFKLSAFAFPIKPQKIFTFFKRHDILANIVGIYSFALFILMRFIKSINPVSLSDFFTADYLDILTRNFGNREVSLLRSAEFLKWRYLDAPYTYKIYTIKLYNKPIGILVARLTEFNGSYFFLVMDCIKSAPMKRWEGFCLRLALISEAIFLNADAIFGLFNRKNKDLENFFQLPFIAVDDKILPHRSPIYASSLAPSLKIEELERMYFSLGDLDYF
jgi:hypothetical protein